MLVIAGEAELAADSKIWGTGGWMEPNQREALDWLTLARMLGWNVIVGREKNGNIQAECSARCQWIVIACDPNNLIQESAASMALLLDRFPILLVARAASSGTPWADLAGVARSTEIFTGRNLSWAGPGTERSWHCRKEIHCHSVKISPDATTWAMLDGAPLIAIRRRGPGSIATLAFHPSEARDAVGAATALLKHLLIGATSAPAPCLDLEHTMILRMDDPGSSENVHHGIYSHAKLDEDEWVSIGKELRSRNARLSIGYVCGWVDDGDDTHSELLIAGKPAPRIPGAVYPSPLVSYRDSSGRIHDYQSEYRGIRALQEAGLAEVELHGYTHIHPDRDEWLRASDRFEAERWFRELGRAAEPKLASLPPSKHPLTRGTEAIREFFESTPTTLICPGEEFTNHTLEFALRLGLQLVGSYYLAFREGDRFCWAQHVCAPYLDEPDPAWFDSGLPVVGYFHDFDLRRNGRAWFGDCLDAWIRAGVRQFITYGDLARMLSPFPRA